jgi:hypothetical protein
MRASVLCTLHTLADRLCRGPGFMREQFERLGESVMQAVVPVLPD